MSKNLTEMPFAFVSASTVGVKKAEVTKGAKLVASHMAIMHNSMARGVNVIYNQAINVAARGSIKEKLDFAKFSYSWAQMLSDHHDGKEDVIFPSLEKRTGEPNIMKTNVDEHQLFHDKIVYFMEYINSVRMEEEELDGHKLRNIIDSFMPALNMHLENEIYTLLELDRYAHKFDIESWWQESVRALSSKAMGTAERKANVFPLMFIFHDRTYEGGIWADFPPIPFLVKLAFRYLFMNKRADWWRFAPCDYFSNPKELPFA